MARPFKTVADELLEHAECVADYFVGRGYTVGVEKTEIGFPSTPTLRCRRSPTTIIVEVYGAVRHDTRLETWTRFARSRPSDTRVAVCVPRTCVRTPDDDTMLRDLGVGLYLSDGTNVEEAIAPKDMAVNVQLPELSSLPLKMRRVLGPAYDQFDRSQWREGFEDACQAVEVLSRKYLATGITSGRIALVTDAGNPRKLTRTQIDKLTLGQLAKAFGQIQNQNAADAQIAKVLLKLNKDRVGVVHHKAKATTEARLRRNVGSHMWTVVAVLQSLGLG